MTDPKATHETEVKAPTIPAGGVIDSKELRNLDLKYAYEIEALNKRLKVVEDKLIITPSMIDLEKKVSKRDLDNI